MNNILIAGKAGRTFLWIMALLFSHTAWAQVTVTVPGTCNVVVPGVGGITGTGGTVGSGGIVVMPDNSGGGGTFTVNPGISTILGWSLAGDISVDLPPLVPGVNPAVQTVGAGILTADIITYNKLLRPSEATSPSSIYLARSKGRVYISYNNPSTTCGGRIEFDIFKEYPNTTYLPPIIGPTCWEADSTYTYSVDQIASDNLGDGIGIDNYYWTVYNGSTYISNFYTSADKSSITLDAPNPVNGPWTITCCFGRANPWDADVNTPTSCVTKTIGVQPPVPVVTIPTCVDIGDPFFAASVPLGPYTYTWNSSNPSWLLTPNLAGNAVTVSALGDGPGIVTLTVQNGSCSSSSSSDTVNRSFVAPDVYIDGADTCLSDGSNYTFSVMPSGIQGNPTCWNLPPGWSFSPLNGTESIISVSVPGGTPAGTYTIDAFACACPTGVVSINVYVRPQDPVIVSGDTCIVYGDLTPLTYTVSPAGSYAWTIPAGWSGSSTTETITVTPNGTGVGTITAQGTNPSGCNSFGMATWNINFEPIDPSGATIGCLNFGYDSNTSAIIANAPSPFFGTYAVTSTPGGLLNGAPTVNLATGAITLHISGTAPVGSYTLHFVHVTPCGTSDTLDVVVTMSALPITLAPTYTVAYDLYQVTPPIGGAYVWYFDGNAISPPNPSPVLFLNNPSGYIPTTVCVNVLNSSTGCYTRVCAPGGTFGRSTALENDDRRRVDEVWVSPNPNDGRFTVKVPKFNTEASVRVMDGNGREVAGYKLYAGDNTIANDQLAAGTYYLLFTIDERVSVQKIQVSSR